MTYPSEPAVLVPKEVANILKCSERVAARLMSTQEIESFRLGPKLWRTTSDKLEEFQALQFSREAACVPTIRASLEALEGLASPSAAQLRERRHLQSRLRSVTIHLKRRSLVVLD